MASNATNPNCFVIQPSTTTFSDFIGYSMLMDQQSNILDTPSLDQFVMARLDNNTAYVNGFRSFFDCPTWNGNNQRLHVSFYEGQLIFLAQNNLMSRCPPPANRDNLQLCQSSCLIARQALSDIFTNPQYCNQNTSPTAMSNRNQTLMQYQQICSLLPTPPTNCLLNVAIERNTCGFVMAQDAAVYCANGGRGLATNDTCCKAFLSGGMAMATSGTGNALTSNVTTATDPAAAGGNRTATIIAIVVGFLGGLAIIIGLYMFIAYRRKRANGTAEDGRKLDPENTGVITPSPVGNENGRRPSYNYRDSISDPNTALLNNQNPKYTDYVQDLNGQGINAVSMVTTAPVTNFKGGSTDTTEVNATGASGQPVSAAMLRAKNALSIYSETGTNLAGTLDSSGMQAYQQAKKSQYKSYVSEYSTVDYGRTSYDLPNNGGPLKSEAEAGLSYTGTDEGGMFKVKVLFQYEKDMDDELTLAVGEIITVTNLFDDGWANGVVGDRKGAFPLACVIPLGDSEPSNYDPGRDSMSLSEATRQSLQRRSSLGSGR